jgi:membrane-associated PAP2 superfamily phosphatase
MTRTGLLIALAVAAVVGLVFAMAPALDLALVKPFYYPETGLWLAVGFPAARLRRAAAWVVALAAAPAFLALFFKLGFPRRPMLIPGRAAVLMIATLALAPGLVTNVILKDHGGRPRPIDVTQFGGTDRFVPWWDPRGDCPNNCSFIGGEASGAFWTLAPAVLCPPQWRVLTTGAALTFGAAVGVLRMAGGGHFFTDVVFAGVFTFLIVWLVHGLLYRWRATRIADATVERLIERIARPGRLF